MKDIQARIETLCTYLGAAAMEDSGLSPHAAKMRDFDSIEPIWILDEWEDPYWRIPLLPLCSGIDVSTASKEPGTGCVAVNRFRLMTPKEARGRMPYSRFMCRRWVTFINHDGSVESAGNDGYLVSRDGISWRETGILRSTDPVGPMISLAPGILWRRERTWRVSIGFSGAPTVDFETSPSGLREVFALRDIPNGKKRREALRHWVKAHWRNRDSTAADTTWVKQHLRGATDFSWNGMRAKIRTPAPEREAELVEVVEKLKRDEVAHGQRS